MSFSSLTAEAGFSSTGIARHVHLALQGRCDLDVVLMRSATSTRKVQHLASVPNHVRAVWLHLVTPLVGCGAVHCLPANLACMPHDATAKGLTRVVGQWEVLSCAGCVFGSPTFQRVQVEQFGVWVVGV